MSVSYSPIIGGLGINLTSLDTSLIVATLIFLPQSQQLTWVLGREKEGEKEKRGKGRKKIDQSLLAWNGIIYQ